MRKLIGDQGIIVKNDIIGHIVIIFSSLLILFLIFIGVMAVIQ